MSEKLIECKILRDTWDEKGKRHKAGSTIGLPIDAVMDGVESGAVERVKADTKKAD